MVAVRSASPAPDATRASDAGSLFIIRELIQNERWKAYAFVQRAPVPAPIVDTDWRRIRARSIRAGTQLRLVRSLVASRREARHVVEAIAPALYRQRGWLALARGWFEDDRIRDALRVIRNVRDHRVLAERQILLGEIRLAIRDNEHGMGGVVTTRHLLDAVPSPAWTELEPQPSTTCREHLMMAVAWTRLGMRIQDPESLASATRHLIDARVVHDAIARRTVLAMMVRSRVDIVPALIALRTSKRGGVADSLLAEYIASRRDPLPIAMHRGFSGLAPTTADARSLDRALHDEGIALSSAASRRRRVLIGIAQTCLRSYDKSWQDDVIEARLRTLVHLGGGLASDAITNALDRLDGMPRHRALEALCFIDPSQAVKLVTDDRLLQIVELRGGIPRGYTHARRRAHAAISRHGHDADAWLAELTALSGRLPEPDVFDLVANQPDLPSTPRALFDGLAATLTVLTSDAHDRVIKHVPTWLDALLLARPARVDPYMPPWRRSDWLALVKAAHVRPRFVEHTTLVTCAELLGLPHYAPLRLGHLPGVPTVTAVGDLRLRLLDKRLDLLTYLRFADVRARSCFRSDCAYYKQTQVHVLDAWQDPLTFCFHVELRDGTPTGFVHGGFAQIDGRIAILLNGLYIRPAAQRIPVLRKLEAALAPLGVARIGIANMYGGHGPLPADYKQKTVRMRRLCALGKGDVLVTKTYDDISYTVNRTIVVDHMHWRD